MLYMWMMLLVLYMTFKLQCLNALFFQSFMCQWFLCLNSSYFHREYVSTKIFVHEKATTIFVHEKGKIASQYYVVCMPGLHYCFALPAHLCLSFCLT
jgi:hypothetical protein